MTRRVADLYLPERLGLFFEIRSLSRTSWCVGRMVVDVSWYTCSLVMLACSANDKRHVPCGWRTAAFHAHHR
jgi:hypothetical protein